MTRNHIKGSTKKTNPKQLKNLNTQVYKVVKTCKKSTIKSYKKKIGRGETKGNS